MEITTKSIALRAHIISIGALFSLVVFPSNVKSIIILLFGLVAFVQALRRPFYFNRKFFFRNSLVFFFIAITYAYSDNTTYALSKLQTISSLLVFPLIFSLYNKEERAAIFKHLYSFFWVYLIGVFLFNVGAFIWFYFTRFSDINLMLEHFPTLIRVRLGKFSIHPIYLSMHCGIAMLFSLFLLRDKSSKWAKFIIVIINAVLFSFLLLYAKKGPIIGLMVILSLFVLFQRQKKMVKPYLLVITTLIFLVIIIPRTRNRFIELIKIENLDQGAVTSTNIRYTIYTTVQDLIGEQPLLGYGIGDYNDVLIKRYNKDGYIELAKNKFNSHNQYFSFILIGGIFVLLAYLYCVGINLIFAIRYDNQILDRKSVV